MYRKMQTHLHDVSRGGYMPVITDYDHSNPDELLDSAYNIMYMLFNPALTTFDKRMLRADLKDIAWNLKLG